MERTITTWDATRGFGRLLQEVAGGDRVVVTRHGHPIAAVVPMEVYEQWKRSRERFFDLLEAAATRANLDPEEADALAAEAVAAVRAQS